MVIQHNLAAMFTQRELKVITGQRSKTSEKLSSGYRVNRAADDAAGLTISEKMRSLVRGLNKASENIQDGISFIQTGEGALNEVHDMMHRIKELAIKSSNGTNTDQDREALDSEVRQIKKEMNRIYNSTEFNTMAIFKAPYVPDIEGMPNDFELFNGSGGAAGVLINHKRYTWGELGVPTTPQATDWEKDITDPDNPNELIRLKINAGDSPDSIHRVYIMTADDTGILVNNLYSGKWDDTISRTGDTYSWVYRGMNLSFEAESGDERSDIISKLNGDGITVNSWDAIPAGGKGASAVTSSRDTLTFNVTNQNKNAISGWAYEIVADDTGVGLVQTRGSDGLTHTKTAWGSFSNTNGGQAFPISDWGTEDEGSNPVTLDSSATYKYKDNASAGYLTNGLEFTFSFPTSEVSRDQAKVGLSQTLTGSSVSAPIASVTVDSGETVTVNSGFRSFGFQRDSLLRDFGTDGASSAMTVGVERTTVTDGTVTDHELRKQLSSAYAKRETATTVSTITRYDSQADIRFFDEGGTLHASAPSDASYDDTKPSDEESAGSVSHSSDYVANTGLDPSWTSHNDETSVFSSAGTETVTRTMTYTDGGVIRTGTVEITFNTSQATRTVTDRSYDKSGSSLADYVSDGHGGYVAAASSSYYVAASGDDLPLDTDGNKYREVTGTSDAPGIQRLVETGQAWIATDTYDLKHNNYSARNSAGTQILSGTSGQFLVVSGTANSIVIHDAAGNIHTYDTQNNSSVRNASLTGGSASMSISYNNGNGDRNNTVTVTPSGPATRTFTKNAQSKGSASDTNLTVKVNPPMKLLNIQAGALQGQTISLEWPALSNSIVGISGAKVNSVDTSLATIKMVDDALDFISDVRSDLGALQNRLESAYRINRNTEENTQAAESLIRDADMAKEMVAHSRNEILTNAAMSMLSQTMQTPQSILQLLQ